GDIRATGGLDSGGNLSLRVLHHSLLAEGKDAERNRTLALKLVGDVDADLLAGVGLHRGAERRREEQCGAEDFGFVLEFPVVQRVAVDSQADVTHSGDAEVVDTG